MAILTDDELREALTDRRAWRRTGDALVRERACRDFAEALALLERLGVAAEDYGRHPEMTITDGNRVRVRVANPNGAGFTDAELRLVVKVDEVTAAVAAEAAVPPPRPRGPLAAVAAGPPAGEPSDPSPAADAQDADAAEDDVDVDDAHDEHHHEHDHDHDHGNGLGMLLAALGGLVVGAVAALLAQRR